MVTCKRCGAEVVDSMHFCPNCGAEIHATASSVKYAEFSEEDQRAAAGTDESGNRAMGVLAYLGWLVLVPLIGCKARFVRYHVRQGLRLAAAETAFALVHWAGWWGLKHLFHIPHGADAPLAVDIILSPVYLGWLGLAILSVIGIFNVLLGREKPVPFIGTVHIGK